MVSKIPKPRFRATKLFIKFACKGESTMLETYTIKDVAEKFNLTISTIRYYDKKGLLLKKILQVIVNLLIPILV